MSATAVRPFDVRGPLPRGVTVLEASAGTGKTYTIAGLAARYVAEGTPLERLLLVTFTRMATGELRDRVRERLVAVERALAGALAGAPAPPGDEVAQLLAEGDPPAVAARRERLATALADFDAATIATIHGFCQEVLQGLGIAGDVEDGTAFVEDDADLLEEVVDDLFVRRFHGRDTPDFDCAQAFRVAQAGVRGLDARLEPAGAPAESVEAMRVRLAEAARQELRARKRRLAVMTYDDLLTRLRDALDGEDAVKLLRRRFGVVLVDEFQDTDRVQWEIFERAFGDGETTLVLIGDPKQAIYAFRGADVYAYLKAAQAAGAPQTLEVNWRSDQGLIDAYDALFDGARLGHEGIVYRRVRAAPANQAPRLLGAPVAAPLRVRVVHRADGHVALTPREYASAPAARAHIAEDLAADVARLLASGATLEQRRDDGTVTTAEPMRPGHVAVLVSRNRTAALIRDALTAAGIRAVIGGGTSVFATLSAREWLVLLEALERPAATGRARAAALTPFIGWSAERVALADDAGWEDVHRRLHRWARVLRVQGVAALMEAVTAGEALPARVLATLDGERALTDLRHVAQLLHAVATAEQLGATALSGWLRRRVAAAERENADEERIRRLESDADAVQVLTIHRSKGLEFPVVYCPDLWEPGYIPPGAQPIAYHEPDGERVVDVGLGGPDFRHHQEAHLAEQRGEDLRLAYVALTRAQHQAVVWWAGTGFSRHSALGRLVF
ncbi:MAG TPA: UvrD-helicase domain-containing protein, partial [Solirubrobacteraceae bacterium]